MKQILKQNPVNDKALLLALLIGMLCLPMLVNAQVVKEFSPRTSVFSPERKIYNIKGDFMLIGNTNMTLQDYSNTSNNGQASNPSVYVDIDGDSNTINSSMAKLVFSDENNADPDCSEVVYAGLYWTGRSYDGGYSTMELPVGGSTTNRINSTNNNQYTDGFRVGITQSSSGTTTYTFTPQGSGSNVVFVINSNGTNVSSVTVKIGNGPVHTFDPQEYGVATDTSSSNSSNHWLEVAFHNSYEVAVGSQTIAVNSLRKRITSTNISNTNHFANVTTGNYKMLSKNKVKLKKAGQNYITVTADVNDIYFPTTSHGMMFSAYAEVTDYVRQHGTGEYFVADLALTEGQGGSTGFYGGWALVVVYENSKMNWRDISIFDGHAYVVGNTTVNHTLNISGFNAVQEGDVNVKIGMMAGEGDVDIKGDYFQMRRQDNNAWQYINHSKNAPTGSGSNQTHNFFNSSINTGGNNRTPNYDNNSGLDIAMFNLPNSDKRFITNGQTSTTFRYGSTQDTYIIPLIIFAVDAYIPDIEVNNTGVQKINDNAVPSNFDYTVNPGDVLEFVLEVKNRGSEPVEDFKVDIPIPFSGLYVLGSAEGDYYFGVSPDSPEFNYTGTADRAGILSWNVGDLPHTGNPDDVLATLTFKIQITDNCAILVNTNCTSFSLTGTSSGKGATSLVSFSGINFITGYNTQSGSCEGEPILGPYNLDIVVTQDFLDACGDPDQYNIAIEYCDITAIPFDATTYDAGVRDFFPEGTRFWSAIEYYIVKEDGTEQVVAANYEPQPGESPLYVRAAPGAAEYTPTNPFALNEGQGSQTYYALPPGFNGSCFWRFTITVNEHCGNYWVGTNSTDWGTQSNWTVGLPGTTVGSQTIPNNVVFATADNNKGVAAINHLYINNDRTIIDLTNDTDKNLVVTPEHMLKITGNILSQASATGTIIVQAHESKATGTLLLDPSKVSNLNATVQFYNKAFTCDDCGTTLRQQWQYFGIPVQTTSLPFGSNLNIKRWDEPAFGDKWTALSSGASLSAFGGYEVNDNSTTLPHVIYNFTGALNIGNANVPLTYSSNVNYTGWNLIGNSFTAAIPISAEAISYSDDSNWEKSVYLFNTGSRHVWRKMSGNQVDGVESGRYTVVPVQLGGQASLPNQIPSMHAFMVLVKGGTGGTLTLDYSELEKNVADAANNQPAWRSTDSGQRELPYIVLDVMGEGSADRVWLFENSSATRGYDSGWDGHKIVESDLIQVYATDADHNKLQVSTVPQFDDVNIGIAVREGENYTITVATHGDVDARRLYLHDTFTGKGYLLRNGTEIVVAGTRSTNQNRFKITASDLPAKMIEESAINTYVRNGMIVVENRSGDHATVSVYDIAGRFVGKANIAKDEMKSFPELSMAKGVLVVKVQSDNGGVARSDRVMLK